MGEIILKQQSYTIVGSIRVQQHQHEKKKNNLRRPPSLFHILAGTGTAHNEIQGTR
jgi:hypothetical protein